ncbi:MAG: hypothetical protein ACFFEF_14115 [Candidatus Thorarchaeota archaeon]
MIQETARAKRTLRLFLIILALLLASWIYDCVTFLVDPTPPLRGLQCRASLFILPFSILGIIILSFLIRSDESRYSGMNANED